MSLREQIKAALCGWDLIWDDGGSARLATQCLYPSNGNVSVVIEGVGSSFVVHDGHGALKEAYAAGFARKDPERLARPILRSFGLKMNDKGIIFSPQVDQSRLLNAIIIVANAASLVAQDLCRRTSNAPSRDIRKEIFDFMKRSHGSNFRKDVKIIGASNKAHKFDYVLEGRGGHQLVLDVVMHDPNSINASVVAHLDLKNAHKVGVEQRIIYDDSARWSSAELHLLRVGAIPVPFSNARELVNELVA